MKLEDMVFELLVSRNLSIYIKKKKLQWEIYI